MLDWLSGFRAQNVSVANRVYATFSRRLAETAAPGGRDCGPCPDFATYNLVFAFQLRKITNKVREAEKRSAGQR